MMRLSQTSAYAVHALSYLYHHAHPTSFLCDIAISTGIPQPYLAKIANKLSRAGLLRAKRGYRGGVALSRPGREISILDVVEATEGKDWVARCPLGLEGCTSQPACPTHRTWAKLSAEFRRFLRTTTLADTPPFSLKTITRKQSPRSSLPACPANRAA